MQCNENWTCFVRRRVGKGIQGSCAPMAERCGRALCCAVGAAVAVSNRRSRRGSLTLALFSVRALRKRRVAYGCHLPARGGPPTCAGLLLAWWSVGGAVGGRGRFAATFAGDWVVGVGAGCEILAALEVFVDYVLRGVVHSSFFIGSIGPMGPMGIFVFS